MTEVFSLSLERDDHLNTLVSKLHSMFEEGIFVDFALAAADGRYLKVHRVILCTFSRYFEVIVNTNYFPTLIMNIIFHWFYLGLAE